MGAWKHWWMEQQEIEDKQEVLDYFEIEKESDLADVVYWAAWSGERKRGFRDWREAYDHIVEVQHEESRNAQVSRDWK